MHPEKTCCYTETFSVSFFSKILSLLPTNLYFLQISSSYQSLPFSSNLFPLILHSYNDTMLKTGAPIIYEFCENVSMKSYPFFIDKLEQVQQLCHSFILTESDVTDLVSSRPTKCKKCETTKFFQLRNIVWIGNIPHQIDSHQMYPSDYFIKVILNLTLIDNQIINPPIEILPSFTQHVNYVVFSYNKLLIIDALVHQGSQPRYSTIEGTEDSENKNERYIYSEHSGVLTINQCTIDSIIVSTETNRVDKSDANIYLPINIELLAYHEFLFHTHPNTSTYGGRIHEGIVYEFPSANDILNYAKYHDEGIAQASIIVAPEGMYIIKPITYTKHSYKLPSNLFDTLQQLIVKIERTALKNLIPNLTHSFSEDQDDNDHTFKDAFKNLTDPDVFHARISADLRYIQMYNDFLAKYNLFIEYYPRILRNGEWMLREVRLELVVE